VLKYYQRREKITYFMFLNTYESLLFSHYSRGFDEIITHGEQIDEAECFLREAKVIDRDHYDKYSTFYETLHSQKMDCIDLALEIFYECIDLEITEQDIMMIILGTNEISIKPMMLKKFITTIIKKCGCDNFIQVIDKLLKEKQIKKQIQEILDESKKLIRDT